jgi:hypothetical protein
MNPAPVRKFRAELLVNVDPQPKETAEPVLGIIPRVVSRWARTSARLVSPI